MANYSKSYTFGSSDDEDSPQASAVQADILAAKQHPTKVFDTLGRRVEKILARRHSNVHSARVEYLVKYVGRAYMHVEWIPNPAALDHRTGQLLQRYINRLYDEGLEDEYADDEEAEHFDPVYLEVDKVIGMRQVCIDHDIS